MAKLEARKKRIGSLDVLQVEGDASAATVILFHGFGADMADLASLAGVIQAKKGTNWIFPNGHLKVAIGPHQEGRAWFPISIAELEKSAAQNEPLDWSVSIPPGMKKARQAVLHMIQELKVPSERLILGGFSQGGMIATDVALHMETPPAGLAVLSGTLINGTEWQELALKLAAHFSSQGKQFSFFQSHGTRDQILSVVMAEKLEKLFLNAKWKGHLLKFQGGHEIPPEVIIQLGAYLRSC